MRILRYKKGEEAKPKVCGKVPQIQLQMRLAKDMIREARRKKDHKQRRFYFFRLSHHPHLLLRYYHLRG